MCLWAWSVWNREARDRRLDIVMYGHTHRPFYEVEKKEGDKDLIVLNPGSLSYPARTDISLFHAHGD